jgi:hypothetical protein
MTLLIKKSLTSCYRVSQKVFYEACNSIIQSLQKELEKDDVTSEDRKRIEDKMIEVAQMIGQKDSENKGLIVMCLVMKAFVVTAIVGVAASILGSNTQISQDDDVNNDAA